MKTLGLSQLCLKVGVRWNGRQPDRRDLFYRDEFPHGSDSPINSLLPKRTIGLQ